MNAIEEISRMIQTEKNTVLPAELKSSFEDVIAKIEISQSLKRKQEIFSMIMDKARALNCEHDYYIFVQERLKADGEPEIWELPKEFESKKKSSLFPFDVYPGKLADFLKATCEETQVDYAMGGLMMLSVLSMCCMGKAVIKYPHADSNHTEPLNLYTLTIADKGERKSGTYTAFTKPIDTFCDNYNQRHHADIERYKVEKARLTRIINSSKKKTETDNATQELLNLKECHSMLMHVSDVTTETLVRLLKENNNRMGVFSDEGGVFDVLAGLYNKGNSNIDIILNAYDGQRVSIHRADRDITIKPLLAIGLMTQPQNFMKLMNNQQFYDRGLIQRFLFAFPEAKAGTLDFESVPVPQELIDCYNSLINKLLSLPNTSIPVMEFDKESSSLLREYFYEIQDNIRYGTFKHLKDYASKQFGKCLRIAGVLHLCEHEPTEKVDGITTFKAIQLSKWSEEQAISALYDNGGTESIETTNAKYTLEKMKKNPDNSYSKTKLYNWIYRKVGKDNVDTTLDLLEDMNYIKAEFVETKGRKRIMYKVNPIIFE